MVRFGPEFSRQIKLKSPMAKMPEQARRKAVLPAGMVVELLRGGVSSSREASQPDWHEDRILAIMERVELGLPTDLPGLPGDAERVAGLRGE
jgi:hypothetical protein